MSLRRRLSSGSCLAVVGLLLPLAGATAADAAQAGAPVRVSIAFEPDTDSFRGVVTSRRLPCERRRQVQLQTRDDEADPSWTTVATDRTDGFGYWEVPLESLEGPLGGLVRARVPASEGCAAGVSREVSILL